MDASGPTKAVVDISKVSSPLTRSGASGALAPNLNNQPPVPVSGVSGRPAEQWVTGLPILLDHGAMPPWHDPRKGRRLARQNGKAVVKLPTVGPASSR